MRELVRGMEIIGIGMIGPLVKETMESAALPFDTLGTPVPTHPTPYLYYEVSFERVFRDDGTVASGRPVLIRFAGTINAKNVRSVEEGFGNIQPGTRGLIFLSEFQGSYQIAKSGYGLLAVDGTEVRGIADGKVVEFTSNKAPEAFLVELQQAIAADSAGR
jgi:hypothetical protein